jgi:RNA polymerase sigma-70 factor (ECF subfamily)
MMAASAVAMSTPDELETWLRDHRHDLVRIACGVVHDPDEAEEVVQDTLYRVWKRAHRGEIRRGAAYLARATYWNALKHRARRREVALEPLDDRTPSPGPSWTLSAFELERAIADLPAHQQAVIRLKFCLGMSYQEIGAALSVSANTAASRCRYALAKLRKRLSGK